jgi:hypothetical protein
MPEIYSNWITIGVTALTQEWVNVFHYPKETGSARYVFERCPALLLQELVEQWEINFKRADRKRPIEVRQTRTMWASYWNGELIAADASDDECPGYVGTYDSNGTEFEEYLRLKSQAVREARCDTPT